MEAVNNKETQDKNCSKNNTLLAEYKICKELGHFHAYSLFALVRIS